LSVSYGVLSTYPPTQCGLATFSAALVAHLASPEDRVGVVAVVDAAQPRPRPEVTHQWVRGDAGGAARAAAALDSFDVVVLQHEYGIYGGPDGADVLAVARALRVPLIVVLHTVLVTPSDHQRAILEELGRLSATLVTMSRTARDRLVEHYAIDPRAVRIIPHGAPADLPAPVDPVDSSASASPPSRSSGAAAPVVLTWGLLGEGKGIEWAIDAMAQLGDLRPAPVYRVVGQTHPKVLEQHGERYRESLRARARELGVESSVQFDARYLDRSELQREVREAAVVLLPYDSREQVTSGVLIEAVAAGRPVVSTGFPHARELLASGAGIVVRRQDPAAIAAAVRRVLTEPTLAAGMAAEARRLAPALLWSAVADQYRAIAADALMAADTMLVDEAGLVDAALLADGAGPAAAALMADAELATA